MRLTARIRDMIAKWVLGVRYPAIRGVEASPGYPQVASSDAPAIACSAVWACVRVISDAIASLPLHLYRRLPDGGRERATDHPLYGLLHDVTAPGWTSHRFRHVMQSWLLLHGNAFALVQRANGNGRIAGLRPISPRSVKVTVNSDMTIRYDVSGVGQVDSRAIIHLRGFSTDGIMGRSVLAVARESIGLALAQERYAISFYRAGGRRPYYVKKLTRFAREEDYEQFAKSWRAAIESEDYAHRAPIVEGDIEIHELGMSHHDAQFLASRQFSVSEICRWFLVPPHLVGDLTRATYANIEHQSLEFVTYTLGYWLGNWEAEISAQLLDDAERSTYYAEFDTKGFLRGDFESRTKGYSTLLQNGVMSINEVRALENMNAIENGDRHYIQLNMQPIN